MCGAVLAAVVAAALAGCTDRQTLPVPTARPGDSLAVWPVGYDTTWIGRAVGFAVRGDRVAIVDPGRKAVHVLDRSSGEWSVLGHEGQGPREFLSPMNAAFMGDQLWVSDVQNARLTRWSPTGEYLRSDHVGVPFYFAWDPDGHPIVRSLDVQYLFEVIARDTSWGLGETAALPAPFRTAGPLVLTQPNYLILEPLEPGHFIVAENDTGTLWLASVHGGRLVLRSIRIPESIRARIRQRQAELKDAFGGWVPAFGGVHWDGRTHAWIRTVPMGILGMVVDLESAAVESVIRETSRAEGRGVVDSFLRGDTLMVLGETGIGGYRITGTE